MHRTILIKPFWADYVEKQCAVPHDGIAALCSKIRNRLKGLSISAEAPEISVVMPAFNEAYYILPCLYALSCLKTRRKIEILLVDNASTDDTGALAESCGVRVVREPRKGIQFARQRGLTEARAPIIAWTETDTLTPPYWVDAILRRFEEDPELIALVGNVKFIDPLFKVYLYRFLIDMIKDLFGMDRRWMAGANLSYRTDAARKIGYSPEVGYGEDDVMVRKLESVWKVARDFSDTVTSFSSARRLNATPVSRMFAEMLARRFRHVFLGQELYGPVRQNHHKIYPDHR